MTIEIGVMMLCFSMTAFALVGLRLLRQEASADRIMLLFELDRMIKSLQDGEELRLKNKQNHIDKSLDELRTAISKTTPPKA